MSRDAVPVRGLLTTIAATAALVLTGFAIGALLDLDRPDRYALARTLGLLVPLLVLRRPRERPTERGLRQDLAHAVLVLTTGSALDVLLRLLVPATADLAFGVAALLACASTYRGLLAWNRVGSGAAARTDWLNGAAAVLAGAALANLFVTVSAGTPLGPLRAARLQLLLLGWSGPLVLLGAVLGVGRAAGFLRDVRPWLLAGSLTLLVVLRSGVVLPVPAGAQVPTVDAGWLLVALAMALCAVLPRREVPARAPAVPGVLLSSLAVSLVAVVVLVAATCEGPARNGDAVVLAVLALGLVGTRVGHLVRVLTGLLRAREETRTDDLTGLPDRRALLAAVSRSAPAVELTLVVVDLTRLREVDERHGHATGDDVLRTLATTLRTSVPPDAVPARLGGAELAVLFTGPGAPLDAHRVVTALGTTVVAGRTFDVGPAAGLATATASTGPLELLRRAHAAVHHAAAGTVVVYDDDADRAEGVRGRLVEELLTAFGPHAVPAARGEFEVHYQPQVTATGEVSGVEALVRWRHPRLGLLTPAAFLPLVEARDLMRPFTAHVVRRAAADLRDWHRQGFDDLTLSVNASASCLGSPFLLPLLDEVIAGGIPGDRLVVEVTETTLMTDPGRALAACHDITARGCGLSIDDYGTGHSSLSYLADLPATEIKIDRSFTARLSRDDRTAAIVAATVDLAHQLGLRTVAEGVEDAATLRRLEALGCDASQGFLHTPALPAGRVPGWLAGRKALARAVAPPFTRD
jgi:diguanylate cyclase (GGDEF)-like protein